MYFHNSIDNVINSSMVHHVKIHNQIISFKYTCHIFANEFDRLFAVPQMSCLKLFTMFKDIDYTVLSQQFCGGAHLVSGNAVSIQWVSDP